ncbi:spinster family MFS transporter [uncultured Sphingomonas sp.]|uniref:spinster family MFS transporter n=1 Tax=uncultured Sphingomonas sp. TaxID=158754 RepID=UPI0035CA1E2B
MDGIADTGVQRAPRYAWYVLAILVLVYVLNFVDRQIIAILAKDIKRDLGVDDQFIGFLFGTAFGVFYAVFGIPLGRLADSWRRTWLMTLGLAVWSGMTTLSGFAGSGTTLAIARVGVGIGEATASPAAYSLISDWFPKRLRATALALYSSGIYIGGGASLFIGGLIVKRWDLAYPVHAPLGLKGWQAAFMAVGIPGLIVALWIATLREPPRGRSEGLATPPPHPRPFGAFLEELGATIPPFTLIGAARRGSGAFRINVLVAVLVASAAFAAIRIDGSRSVAQWGAVGIGVYAVFSWSAALRERDPATFALTLGTPAFVGIVIAYGLNALVAYAVAAFGATYVRDTFAVSAEQAGLWIGAPAALSGFLGITIGGRAADWLRQRHASGRIMVVLFGGMTPLVPVLLAFRASSATIFFVMVPIAQLLASSALGASAAATQDLVLPRMRGTATAVFFIGTTLIGLSLGPYMAGRISVATGSLATGVSSLLMTMPFALVAGLVAYRLVPAAEATRIARARASGEPA